MYNACKKQAANVVTTLCHEEEYVIQDSIKHAVTLTGVCPDIFSFHVLVSTEALENDLLPLRTLVELNGYRNICNFTMN